MPKFLNDIIMSTGSFVKQTQAPILPIDLTNKYYVDNLVTSSAPTGTANTVALFNNIGKLSSSSNLTYTDTPSYGNAQLTLNSSNISGNTFSILKINNSVGNILNITTDGTTTFNQPIALTSTGVITGSAGTTILNMSNSNQYATLTSPLGFNIFSQDLSYTFNSTGLDISDGSTNSAASSTFDVRPTDPQTRYIIRANANYHTLGVNVLYTRTPSAVLHVEGNGNTNATTAFKINDNQDVNLLTVLDNGFVGFGTTTPTRKLHLHDGNFYIDNTYDAYNITFDSATAYDNILVNGGYYGAIKIVDTQTFVGNFGSLTSSGLVVNNSSSPNEFMKFGAGGYWGSTGYIQGTMTNFYIGNIGFSLFETIYGFNTDGVTATPLKSINIPTTIDLALNNFAYFTTSNATTLTVRSFTNVNTNTAFQVLDNAHLPLLKISSAGNIGIGTSSPQAILDITSTTSGILIPRITTTQKNAITTPIESELLYDSSLHSFNYYDGTNWITFENTSPTLTYNSTDDVVTQAQAIPVPTDSAMNIETTVVYIKTGGSGLGTIGDGASIIINGSIKNVGGVLTLGTISNTYTDTINAISNESITYSFTGTNITLLIKGVANDNIKWNIKTKTYIVS